MVNHPQADHLNEQIRRVYDGIHEKMSSIASTKGEYDLSLLKKVKKTKLQGSSAGFLDWLEERIDMRPITESTRKLHISLTMHVGRHTFATWALTKGVGIETVSKMLAHSNVSMTEKYAQVLQTSVIQGFALLK